MFTLVMCLVVVALSGAAVLHITLVDQTKRATPQHRRRLGPDDSPSPALESTDARPVPAEPDSVPEPTRATPAPPRSVPAAPTRRGPPSTPVVIETHRARSAGRLALLVAVLGCLLAIVVAVAAVVAVVALRAAVVG